MDSKNQNNPPPLNSAPDLAWDMESSGVMFVEAPFEYDETLDDLPHFERIKHKPKRKL